MPTKNKRRKRRKPQPTPEPTPEPMPEPTPEPTTRRYRPRPRDDEVAFAERRPRVSGSFSANSDVLVDYTAPNTAVNVDANIAPAVEAEQDADADVNITGNADSRVTVSGVAGAEVGVDLDQETQVHVGEGTRDVVVNVNTVTRPDIFVGPEVLGDYPADSVVGPEVEISAESSPEVNVLGDNAQIHINTNIVPSITLMIPNEERFRRERSVAAPPSEWRRPGSD